MKHLNNLIKATIEDSKAPWAISEDMVDMYKQDAKDFKAILNMIKDKNYSGAKKLVQHMDTLPREGAIVAIAYDLGNLWVAENLGYEIN
tara:strand:+ start:112 stop:378 length:267 start_codon:yes stop_codon:yes gene_type:complete